MESLGLIGAGRLAQSLAAGWLAAGYSPDRIWVTNRSDGDRLRTWDAMGCHTTADLGEVCHFADTLLLLFKPKDLAEAAEALRPCLQPRHLVISCLAGTPLRTLESRLGERLRIMRAMPNTASAVRASATALCPGSRCTAQDLESVRHLFTAVGEVWVVPETWMDAATAVIGSGPAYVFLFMEAFAEAATAVGLPPELAPALVQQTVLGAAKLAQMSAQSFAELRAAVTSPGGTTGAALEVFAQRGWTSIVREAVQRAVQRGEELARLTSTSPR